MSEAQDGVMGVARGGARARSWMGGGSGARSRGAEGSMSICREGELGAGISCGSSDRACKKLSIIFTVMTNMSSTTTGAALAI